MALAPLWPSEGAVVPFGGGHKNRHDQHVPGHGALMPFRQSNHRHHHHEMKGRPPPDALQLHRGMGLRPQFIPQHRRGPMHMQWMPEEDDMFPPVMDVPVRQSLLHPGFGPRLGMPQQRPPSKRYDNLAAKYLTDPDMEAVKSGDMTVDLATVKIVQSLTKGEGRALARSALRTARDNAIQMMDGEATDIPWNVFATLDEGIFMGKLADGVYIDWFQPQLYPHYRLHSTETGMTLAPNSNVADRVAILLNHRFSYPHRDGAPQSPVDSDEILGMFLHQLIHAYFLRQCGVQKKGKEPDGRLKHDVHFWKVWNEIVDVAKGVDSPHRRDGPSFADVLKDLHGKMGAGHHGNDTYPPGLYGREEFDTKMFDRSTCCNAIITRKRKAECDEWFDKIEGAAESATSKNVYRFKSESGEVKPSSRSEKGSPADYVEIVWDGKPFNYSAKSMKSDGGSLYSTHFAGGRREIQLPPGEFDKEAMFCLDQFIKSGDWRPDPSLYFAHGDPGPPTLAVVEVGTPNHLLTDIKAYKIAYFLQYREMKKRALQRLNSTRVTHADPLTAFAEIYRIGITGTAPQELRAWARDFMTKGGNLDMMESHGSGVDGLVVATGSPELNADYQACVESVERATERALQKGVVPGSGPVPPVGSLMVQDIPLIDRSKVRTVRPHHNYAPQYDPLWGPAMRSPSPARVYSPRRSYSRSPSPDYLRRPRRHHRYSSPSPDRYRHHYRDHGEHHRTRRIDRDPFGYFSW